MLYTTSRGRRHTRMSMWCISTRLKLTRSATARSRRGSQSRSPERLGRSKTKRGCTSRTATRPYADTAEAVRHWPETCTAIAARTLDARIELLAPFGVDDLISLVVQPTPAFANKIEVYRARVARKAWQVRWPKLRSIDYSTEPGADRLLSPYPSDTDCGDDLARRGDTDL